MMIRNACTASHILDVFRPKINFFSQLNPETCKSFRRDGCYRSFEGRGITTSTSFTRGKEEKEVEGNKIKPVKMAYTSYELTEGGDAGNSDQPPIIIMHGLLGSKNNWNSLSRAIHNKTKRKVVAVDARNHGESPHTPELSYQHLAMDIKELMSDLNISKATLMGHSMGGRAVMLFALTHPELVRDLIVVDISPLRVSPNLKNMLKCFEAMRLVKVDSKVPMSSARKSADAQLGKYITDPGLRQFLLTNLIEGEDGKYKWRVNLDAIANNFSTNISNFPPITNMIYKGPTQFIGGTLSDFLIKEEEGEIKKFFPKALFTYISEAGHWVHSDKPQEFLSTVFTFFQKSGEEGPPRDPRPSPARFLQIGGNLSSFRIHDERRCAYQNPTDPNQEPANYSRGTVYKIRRSGRTPPIADEIQIESTVKKLFRRWGRTPPIAHEIKIESTVKKLFQRSGRIPPIAGEIVNFHTGEIN